MFKCFNKRFCTTRECSGIACLMTYDRCDVTCRETTAGHLWAFGDVAPLRCVLGNPGWRGERDSYLPNGSDAFRASKTTFEQNETAQSHSLQRNPLNIDLDRLYNGSLSTLDWTVSEIVLCCLCSFKLFSLTSPPTLLRLHIFQLNSFTWNITVMMPLRYCVFFVVIFDYYYLFIFKFQKNISQPLVL